jgi:hypothetical protein
MSFSKVAVSAVGKLALLALVLAVFLAGMAGVVYMSLQGEEIKVPEITGKNFAESETELASLGLKIKKRADRVSADPPNTVIEQLPKAGETVKTGQLILVVTSKEPVGGETLPQPKLPVDSEDAEETIKEMISDKPKKKANTNTKKKADTSRDVNANAAANSATGNSNNKAPSGNSSDKPTKQPAPGNSKPPAANSGRPSGDSKPRP